MYLTRTTAAVVAAVVSAKRVVVANNMKISKARLEQIIKEELTESDIFAEDMSLEGDDIEEFITGRMYYYDFEDVLGWLETQPYFEKRDLLAYLKTDPSSFRPYMYDNQKVERVSTEGLWNLVSGHILDQSTEKRGKELIKLLMIAIKHGREAEIMGDVFPEIKKITDTNRENFIKQTKADEEEAEINIKQMDEHKMKLTKQKLQKIIEEELEKLTVKEGSMGAGLGTHKCAELEQKHKDVYADMSTDPTGQSGMFLGRIEDEAKKLKCPWAEKIPEASFDNLKEEAFPEDKYKDLKRLRSQVRLAGDIRDTIGKDGYEALFDLKKKINKVNEIPKDKMTTDDKGDPQSERYVKYTELQKKALNLFKDKKDRSIALNMISSFFDRDQPDLDQLDAMEDKLKALSGEFEVKRGATDDQDRYYGRTSTTVTHKPSGTSKKVLSKQGSLGT